MKFSDKYPQLKERQFLSNLLSKSVFSTMSLEDQTVAMPKIVEIVKQVLSEKESKSGQLFTD
jgi:hypothetical protein